MTNRISRELLLLNFKRVDILCPIIRHPSEIVWLVDFLESFLCPISSVSIYYVPNSDIRVKSYDHSNFSRASVVQFQESRWVMYANRTSVWKVMTIRISRVFPLCNFERVDILCAKFGHPCEKLSLFEFLESVRCSISRISIYYAPESDLRVKSYDHLKFSRASVFQFWASLYVMLLNRSSGLKVMIIWISQELSLFNFERLDILCA